MIQPWGPALDVTWHTSLGDYQGIALVVNGELYAALGAGAEFGLMTYTIAPGRLEGEWVLWRDREGPGKEWGTPRGRVRRSLIGTWEMDGHLPGAPEQSYRSLLTITRLGRTYLLTWDTGGSIYQGVGFRHGDTLVVGWALDTAGGLVRYRLEEEEARGRWAVAGNRKRGREQLVRR